MSEKPAGQQDYHLGHNEHERQRLQRQHRLYEPFTRQLLVEAGISPGMKVLDVGSGMGDVALLLAQLVGPDGAVTGLEMNQTMLAAARNHVEQAGITNLRFIEANLNKLELDQKYDAVVGRWVLVWMADPVQVLCSLAGLLNPGGLVVFQETIYQSYFAYPPSAILEAVRTTLEPASRLQPIEQRWIGLSLNHLFLQAGLPSPQTRVDTPVGGGPDWEGYQYLQDGLQSLLPAIQKAIPETAIALQIDTLAVRLREETVRQQGLIMCQPVVGAWTHI